LHEISGQLAAGVSQSEVARRFNFKQQTISKHFRTHMREQMREHDTFGPVLRQVHNLNQRVLRILDRTEWRDPAVALQAARECRGNLELIGKITGEIRPNLPQEDLRVEVVYIDKQVVVSPQEPEKPLVESTAKLIP
jgi:hypothetical protein